MNRIKQLVSIIFKMEKQYQYDYFVIGGGSGGMASASAAVAKGAKVGLADYVTPSPQGTTWGMGGTCVNVGCVPKKLFHVASLLSKAREDIKEIGWEVDHQAPSNWEIVAQKVQNHIKKINQGYKNRVEREKIDYYNKLAKLLSPHEIELKGEDNKVETVTAKYILIAVGGRPTQPDIPGKEHTISSDDIFWLKKAPGKKVLVVGGSYIALESGGFMHGLGLDVTIMVRSIFLRGFDQQLANKVGQHMEQTGVKFIKKAVPTSITVNNEGKKVVKYKQDDKEHQEEYDAVMFAIGRSAETKALNLEAVGVKTAKNGKVIAGDNDQTSVTNIYAIGDCCEGRLELTPTAIKAGRLLVARLFGDSKEEMSYKYVPTTVFTPLEYASCGYSQEEAIEKFGKENIIAYGSEFRPMLWAFNQNRKGKVFIKLLVNKAEDEKVVGLHYFGPEAGEIMQGFAACILNGITKKGLDRTVAIHPTLAEQLVLLKMKLADPEEEKNKSSS